MKESEIRPQTIFDEYLALCEKDIVTYFKQAACKKIDCPACSKAGILSFAKKGFSYNECPACMTLFVSPRPEKEAFEHYYLDSPSTKFWATTFYKETESARREKLWKPKARLIKKKIEKYSEAKTILDIGGGYGTFAEEIKKIMDIHILVIEPSVHLAQVCREKGLEVIQDFMENISPDVIPKESKVFVSYELFEHLYDPAAFIKALHYLMEKGDLFIFTTLNGMGIDIQVLWKNSKSVSPPHHLNFFNPKSLRLLLNRLGFTVLEITTPGKLDLDIMENNLDCIQDRFWKNFLQTATDLEKEKMQIYISDNLLSSHMMAVCSKT